MIKFLVFWMLCGLLFIVSVSVGHAMRAMQVGYTAKTIMKANERLLACQSEGVLFIFVGFIFGLFIWPIRIFQFVTYQVPYRMALYELIQNENKEDS